MLAPYIGITDFTDFSQVKAMKAIFDYHKPKESNRILAVGVMMSYKTLYGLPTKWSTAFPPKEDICGIFSYSRKEVLNCLHYADYDGQNDLAISLIDALEFAGPSTGAVQLDMVWPDPDDIDIAVRDASHPKEVILQLGEKALGITGNNPRRAVKMLEDYEGIVHRVLLDKSMGRGLGLDAEFLLPFARTVRERFPDWGIGVAGGLGPQSMHLVEPMLEEFPDISIDAQGKLRPSGKAFDPIAWNMAAAYLTRALNILEPQFPPTA